MERRREVDSALGLDNVDLILSEIDNGLIKEDELKMMALAMENGVHGVFIEMRGMKKDLPTTLLYMLDRWWRELLWEPNVEGVKHLIAVLKTSKLDYLAEEIIQRMNRTAPWRNVGKNPWTEKEYESLKKEIATHEHLKSAGIGFFNILLVGQIGAGKSSFVNTVESAFSDHVTMRANAGNDARHVTTQFRTYKVRARDYDNKPIRFKFWDSPGLEGMDAGLQVGDVAKIMDGHVNDQTELFPGGRGPGDIGYNPTPGFADKMHCVAFVVNALSMFTMDDEIPKKFKEIREEANHRSLTPIIILTHVDQIFEETDEDITNVFNSQVIKDKVQHAEIMFGINKNKIYPVQNYSSEVEKKMGIDILTLKTLGQILRYSQDFLQDKEERDEDMRLSRVFRGGDIL